MSKRETKVIRDGQLLGEVLRRPYHQPCPACGGDGLPIKDGFHCINPYCDVRTFRFRGHQPRKTK